MAADKQRLEYLDDELALQKHMDRYQRAADTNDWEAFTNCFTDDMVFEFEVGDAAKGIGVIPITNHAYKGIKEAIPFLQSLHVPFAKTQHFITNKYFEINGTNADGRANVLFAGVSDPAHPKENTIFGCRYTWKFRKTKKGWRTTYTKVEKVWER